jgi:lipopolysaccharide biosynthesis glycosyltransferase
VTLNIVYSSDNLYAQHVGVSMISLFENNKDLEHIRVYLIENQISEDNKNHLKIIARSYKRTVEFMKFSMISDKLKLSIGNSISINAYARLFLASLLPRADKVLYLDCDTIINDGLSELWNMDIENVDVAGVCDTVSDDTKASINREPNHTYINSGILIMNLKRWRTRDLENKFVKFIDKHRGYVFHHDQGTINGVCEKISLLHPKYNAMSTFFTMSRKEMMQYYGMKHYYSEFELKQAVNDPVIIHFTPAFVTRPWVKGCKHPLASLYKKYLDMSPWRGKAMYEDRRSHGEKIIAFMYNHLPFKLANGISKIITR